MKYSLTISSDNPAELAKLLASLGGSTAATGIVGSTSPVIVPGFPANSGPVMVPQASIAATDDDDESNDNANVAVGSLDKDGLPHDARIHSEPAKLTGKNVWRKKRGVSDALVSQVEAELRARMTAPQQTQPVQQFAAPPPTQQFQQPPQQQFTPPPSEQFTVPPSITGTGQPVVLQTQPQAAPVQQFQQPPQAAPSMDFGTFMSHIQAMLPQGIVDAPYLNTVANRLGVAAITDIAANQQMIDMAVQIMVSEQRWR